MPIAPNDTESMGESSSFGKRLSRKIYYCLLYVAFLAFVFGGSYYTFFISKNAVSMGYAAMLLVLGPPLGTYLLFGIVSQRLLLRKRGLELRSSSAHLKGLKPVEGINYFAKWSKMDTLLVRNGRLRLKIRQSPDPDSDEFNLNLSSYESSKEIGLQVLDCAPHMNVAEPARRYLNIEGNAEKR